tara:strand:- start:4964 stop:5542 length:579 start_codon:yes stop_codon:yes gene_type:complete
MIQFYKPNKATTGNACSFWLNKDGSIMASMIKQDSWDNAKRRGTFSKNKGNPHKSVITKLSRVEVAGIIDAIESNREWSAYHRSQKQVLTMKFCPYLRNGDQIGFSFSINKQDAEDSTKKSSYVIGLYFPEGRLLKHDLEVFLDKTLKIEAEVIKVHPAFTRDAPPVTEHDLEQVASGGSEASDPFEDGEIF